MEFTLENCQSVVVNNELRKLTDKFVKETVSTNKLPWFMMENALEHALSWVKEKSMEETEEAQAMLPYLAQVGGLADNDGCDMLPVSDMQEQKEE